MPVISEMHVSLTTDEVICAWGPRRARLITPRMLSRISEILERMDAEQWLRPAVTYRVWEVMAAGPGWMELVNGSRLRAPLLNHHLPRATHLATGVCTLGSALEQQVREWFASSERLSAVLLDDIGTFALYKLSDRFEKILQQAAEQMGLEASGVLAPGEDGFDLAEQRTVAELSGGADIGVALTATGMFVPRKTLSLLVGFGHRMPRWSRGERCAVCSSRERCPHRRLIAEVIAT
jgi:hypothetical protein